MTQTFHLGDILSISTGYLVAPEHIDGVYKILNFMTGDNLFTHQLPRACRECAPHLIRQFPWLAEIQPEGFATPASVEPWLAAQVERYGAYHEVEAIPRDDHDVIDPISELQQMAPDIQIIPVVIDPDHDLTA